jgi:hypothetical protein
MLAEHGAAVFHRRLAATLPAPRLPVDPAALAERALAAQERTARPAAERAARADPATGPGRPAAAPPDHVEALRPRIERRTASLAMDAAPADVAEVLDAAAAVMAAAERAAADGGHPLGAAGPRLELLSQAVERANARARTRREAAAAAARYLEALEQPVGDELPDGPVHAVAARLREVVAGDRAFDDELAAAAERQRARVEDAARRLFTLATVRDILTGQLGYTVEGDVETLRSDFDRLRLTRPGWEPDHHATVVVEGGRVRGGLVRDTAADDADAVRQDTERCETFLDDLSRLDALLAGGARRGSTAGQQLRDVARHVQFGSPAAGAGADTGDETLGDAPRYRERQR